MIQSLTAFSLFACISLLALIQAANAESWLDEGFREFEELRLRQLQTVQTGSVIAPFSTDGCSGGQSTMWRELAHYIPGFEEHFADAPPWESCCVMHDKAYWQGQTFDGFNLRKKADEALKDCVITVGEDRAGELSDEFSLDEDEIIQAFSVTAELMYQAVRLGGAPCSLLPWRWGYGWQHCAFSALSDTPDSYSDLKPDEHATLFNTAAWFSAEDQTWSVPIHAWVYEPQQSVIRKNIFAKVLKHQYDLVPDKHTEANFTERTNLLIADNEREKRLVIRIAGQDVTLPLSVENGHTQTTLTLSDEQIRSFSNRGFLHYSVVLHPDDKRQYQSKVKLVARDGFSVISDIDDTIKVTGVTDRKQLFHYTFFEDFEVVPGMPALYQNLAKSGANVHFVSSSPWQLYQPLENFMKNAGFPWATLNLKNVRFRDETLLNLFKPGTETKPKQIETLLKRYPDRRFILVGDNGEQDPEIYGDIARRYPEQISHIWIRNIASETTTDERYKTAFAGTKRKKWRLFESAEELTLSQDSLEPTTSTE